METQTATHKNGKRLYNGITLPAQWPPRNDTYSTLPLPRPWYVDKPPDVIPIDVGRQLFVDDFLIEKMTLDRVFHIPHYYDRVPVLVPDKPWESTQFPDRPIWRDEWAAPTAMVFSDGVWYDPSDSLFKMWYMGGMIGSVCYALSKDGIEWEKPDLDVEPGTNRVYSGNGRESSTVWLDLEEEDPARRYKLFFHKWPRMGEELQVCFSPDGIHWTEPIQGGINGDRTTAFYNPFRKVWVFSIRSGMGGDRIRRYHEHGDVVDGCQWSDDQPVFWVGADELDRPVPGSDRERCDLYNLDCVAYESVLLGLFSILQGHVTGRPKLNEVKIGFSRDGFNWDRSFREPFLPLSDVAGAWNRGNVQSAGGCCLVVGDELYFYTSGRAGEPGTLNSGVCTTGLAVLRRDGFASLDASRGVGEVTTRPVVFRGSHLFVNCATQEGSLRAEVLNSDGSVIKSFSRADCIPVAANRTRVRITWSDGKDLSSVAGRPVRFRFYVENGELYAFWVTPDTEGASYGYLAAGGPGCAGPVDVAASDSSFRARDWPRNNI